MKGPNRALKKLAGLVFAGVALPYFFYRTYDDWETVRFVLPGLAFLLIVCAVGVNVSLARLIGPRWAPLGALAVASVLAVASYVFAQRHGAFSLGEVESRYRRLGEWIAATTPEDVAVLAMQHSGNIRFYGRRVTLRWDVVPPDRLHDLVSALQRRDRRVYLALDGPTEETLFRDRFDEGERARLALTPAGRISGINVVEIDARE